MKKINYGIIRYKISAGIKIIFYTIIKKITRSKMIIDVTGTILTPGNEGQGCMGNGYHINKAGKEIECCCGGCDYMMCCMEEHDEYECVSCTDKNCPRSLTICRQA